MQTPLSSKGTPSGTFGLLNRWILTGSLQFEVNGTSTISVDPMRPMRYSFPLNVIDRQPPPYTPPARPEPRCCRRRPPDRAVAEPICRGFCLQNLGPPSSSLAPFISPNISPKNLTGGQTDSVQTLAGAPSLCACVFALPSDEGVCVEMHVRSPKFRLRLLLRSVCAIRRREIWLPLLEKAVQKLRSTNKYSLK